jgi:hypothetical protein
MQLLEKSVIKYDLIAAPSVSDWSNIMIGPGGLLLGSSSQRICCPKFQNFFMGGGSKKVNN